MDNATIETALEAILDPESQCAEELWELAGEIEELEEEREGSGAPLRAQALERDLSIAELRYEVEMLAEEIERTPDLERIEELCERESPLLLRACDLSQPLTLGELGDEETPEELSEEAFNSLMDQRAEELAELLGEEGFSGIEVEMKAGCDRIYLTRRGWRWFRVEDRAGVWVALGMAF